MLLIDGVKYELWVPASEEELEKMVEEHSNDIFGEMSIYFDNSEVLKARSGIGSIPDAYVIALGNPPTWRIVEIELSIHPLFTHIVSQISKFVSGFRNPSSQNQIATALYDKIIGDDFKRLQLRRALGSIEIHKFISDLISKDPVLTVVIERETDELAEALAAVPYQKKEVVEFQTFVRQDVGLPVHAHLFKPLFAAAPPPPPPPPSDSVEITLSNPSCLNFSLFFIPKEYRAFFPGYKIPFVVETDVKSLETWVSSAPKGTVTGDPKAGVYVQRNLFHWFKAHPELRVGSRIMIEAIEPMKRYRLKVI